MTFTYVVVIVIVTIDRMMGEGSIIDTSVNITFGYVPPSNVESIVVVEKELPVTTARGISSQSL